jgi:glyoxylase-like metal-dependent hydrolase (beta-lactamase superfamily II)
LQSYEAGNDELHVIKVGDFKLNLSQMLKVPEAEWRPKYGDLFETPVQSPGNCIFIRTTDASIVVDPNDYLASCTPDSEYYPSPDYQPPPDLVSQLSEISVRPENVTHVVITHAHYDHYAGVTRKNRSGKYEPTYPNARYFLGAKDWRSEMVREGLEKENSDTQKTLGTLNERKMLQLVDGDFSLSTDVRIISAPGESPGHQLVELQSAGQSFYCVGDLFHHWVEVNEPEWGADWADASSNGPSKRALCEAAVSKNSLVIPGHMSPGRVHLVEGSYRWKDEE